MAPPLYDDAAIYADTEVPTYTSQLAKDLSTFLKYVAEPYHDNRKQWMAKFLIVGGLLLPTFYYLKRHKWTVMNSRKIVYQKPTQKPYGPSWDAHSKKSN